MPRLSKELKEKIGALPCTDLKDIVLKLTAKEKWIYDFMMINYLDKEAGQQIIFEEAKKDLNVLFGKNYRGYATQIQVTNMLTACVRRVNEFTKLSKNKELEANLLVHILQRPYLQSLDMYGTCFTQFDNKVAQIVKRLITIVTKKLHEDLKIEYDDLINDYLKILHIRSRHLDRVYTLPKSV